MVFVFLVCSYLCHILTGVDFTFTKIKPTSPKLSVKKTIYRDSDVAATIEMCIPPSFPVYSPLSPCHLSASVFTVLSNVYVSPLMVLMATYFVIFDDLLVPLPWKEPWSRHLYK